MEFIRFTSSQRYGTRVPLRQLAFVVTVSRTFLIEDEEPEVLCEVTVPWGAKLPSPQERLNMYKQLQAALSASAERGKKDEASEAHPASDSLALPTLAEVVEQLRSPSHKLFTRPPMEDFIDPSEEDFPVDPPMGPSLLAPVVLRQHRRDHRPNDRMHFLWTLGDITGAPPAPSRSRQSEEASERPGEGAAELTEGSAAATEGGGLLGLAWVGEERVLCTITAEKDEGFFTAKPSLNTPHTILVDAVYIHSFTICAVDMASLDHSEGIDSESGSSASLVSGPFGLERRSHGHRQWDGDAKVARPSQRPSMGGVLAAVTATGSLPAAAAAAATTTLAAAEQASDGIRTVATQATEGLEVLRRSEEGFGAGGGGAHGVEGQATSAASQALAQSLLRDAAMLTLDGGGDEANTRAAADVLRPAAVRTAAVAEDEEFFHGKGGTAGGDGFEATARRLAPQGRRANVAPGFLPGGEEGRRRRYHVFGVVERCLGLPYDTLYLKCMLVQDTLPGAEARAARDVPLFFLEREALAAVATGSSRAQHSQETLFTTQLAYAGAVTVEDYLVEVDHVFNVPFEHSYVDDSLPKAPLRLMVTALSEGFSGDGSQAPVGYCCVTLPVAVPGTHKVRSPMWTPHPTGREFVKSATTGGRPSLVDGRESGPPLTNRTGISVRQGLLADSAGMLCLTVNVAQQIEVT